MDTFYTDNFFESRSAGSLNSAQEVVPLILTMLPGVASVVDVGCGTGTWLHTFKESGVRTVLGLDGDYVNRDMLMVEPREFVPTNLNASFSIPGRFDLLTSLEVAEHLPASFAYEFVQTLTKASDRIVFSAAVPNQGGTNHVNEQPASYWIAIFRSLGFTCHDYLRPVLWNNPKIAIEYKQNAFLFIKDGAQIPVVKQEAPDTRYPYDAIHPDLLQHHLGNKKSEVDFILQGRLGIKDSFRIFRRAIANKIK